MHSPTATDPAARPDAPAARRRVLVVSAGMGAGHHAAADELVRQLRTAGQHAERVDLLTLGRPGQGRRLARTYALLLRWAPWLYDAAMRVWRRWPRPLEALTARGARAYQRGLAAEIRRVEPDVVVSVYNLASQALGRLRAAGALAVPVVSYVTDPGPHPYWVHPAVDLHVAVLPSTARALGGYGAPRTAVVGPLVDPVFRAPLPDRAAARRALGLPADGIVALVSAGSWAAGAAGRTAETLAAADGVLPVTLCGRDAALRRRLTDRGAGLPLGWRDDMPTLLAAADVLVDNAGGLTCWEALVAGVPVVLVRPLPGHGRMNAAELAAGSLVGYARGPGELLDLVRSPTARPAAAALRAAPADGVLRAVLALAAAGRPG